MVIKDVARDGSMIAFYLNPNPIRVSKAKARIESEKINIYVEMQDVGYPGSNYTLTYDKDNDQLVGIYYHAILKQRFDIYFEREEN